MSRRRRRPLKVPDPTAWQVTALRDINSIATAQPEDISVIGAPEIQASGTRVVRVGIRTAGLPERAPNGVRFRAVEEFDIHLEPTGDRPPPIVLDHFRFLGVAHVMSGLQICLYLDPSRDWDLASGVRGVLGLLWQWMEHAATDQFNPGEAIYHAVGGVAHVSPGTPLVVVRDLPDRGRHLDTMYLRRRNDDRLDLIAGPPQPGDQHVPVVRLRRDIPVGAGSDILARLMERVEKTQGLQPVWPDDWLTEQNQRLFTRKPERLTLAEHAVTGHFQMSGRPAIAPVANPWGLRAADTTRAVLSPAAELAASVVASATRNPQGSRQYAVLTVPHPSGGAGHVLCLRIPAQIADTFRRGASDPAQEIDPYRLVAASGRMPMEWCRVSDERAQVTTRRDTGRPVTALHGSTVHIWGLGGLGSWLAEFAVRAGVRRLVLHDVGRVTGGLLVRQNYLENDVGAEKASALATRLRSIRDDIDLLTLKDLPEDQIGAEMLAADLVIDATVSRVVGRLFNEIASDAQRQGIFAQVATDARTGTLGLASVLAAPKRPGADETENPDARLSLSDLDEHGGRLVHASAALEPYRVFWEPPLPGDEFVPTRGCSLPTFHGSAADLAAVAAGLLNFVSMHLGTHESGLHLMSLPHSGVTPAHHYVAATMPAVSDNHSAA